jgi:acyl carrier protein
MMPLARPIAASKAGSPTETAPMSSLKQLQDLVHEKFGIEESALDPNASMREKGFDSLALVEFLFAIEDQFGISMSDQDSDIDTLAQLSTVVDKLVAAKTA